MPSLDSVSVISAMAGCSGGDTVVLVRDPLANSGEAQGSRGGQAEGEGIKMACPPRQVRRLCFIDGRDPFRLSRFINSPHVVRRPRKAAAAAHY